MKKLEYVIRDEIGIHARPAGELVKEAKNIIAGSRSAKTVRV